MSIFADRILLQFLQDAFIEELLQNQLGLSTLFSLAYKTEEIELREISLAGVQRRQFQMPAFETIRTTGTEERILPAPERIQVNRTQPRYGRLSWVEVFLEVLLLTKFHKQGSPIERIATNDLIAELGGVDSLAELRNKLAERYSESVVEAFLKKLKIASVEEFKKNANLFIEFFYQEPPAFDPDDPQNSKTFRLNICVKLQSELNLMESLQTAKLCRSILENERDFAETFEGGEIKMPYVFLTIFPESVAVDNAIPGLNATQIQQGVKALFATEGMLAHFWQPEQPEE
jgi:hypothetical protein